ncbi:hypothetical protein SH668x_001580 [Planctomicrobium sp. SH668]|uniref:hypothetical protein n=1 Tax=Planctomicrobium sp. SH668 TaxID=3448126 RepID=UPI003F5C5220
MLLRNVFLFALGCLLCGCGGASIPSETVQGTVSLDGKPLPFVGVRFTHIKKGFGTVANVNSKGEFQTPSPLEHGTYEISITGLQPSTDLEPDAPPPSPAPPESVPNKYLKAHTSRLTFDVSATSKSIPVALDSKGDKKRGNGPTPTAMAPAN